MNETEEILRVTDLEKHFRINNRLTIKAVDGVSFGVKKGEVFGLVGESGSGKSTVARTIMGIYAPTGGSVYYKGTKISDPAVYRRQQNDIHRSMQIIFQDSAAALNPRMTVAEIVAEPIKVNRIITDKAALRERLLFLLGRVGLDESCLSKYPPELSGGQRQRAAIARGISTDPDLIIADEPVASLDVSIQAQIITLFQHLQQEHQFSFLLIAHDLSVIKFLTTRVAVMLHGKLVELAPTKELFANPLHAYTKSLLSAVPIPDPRFEKARSRIDYDTSTLNSDGMLVEVLPGHFVLK